MLRLAKANYYWAGSTPGQAFIEASDVALTVAKDIAVASL